MSDVRTLLDRLRAADIRLTLDGDRLGVSAPKGALTQELRGELEQAKEALKAHLRSVEADRAEAALGIRRVARTDAMPVSHTQQRLWFLKQLDPASPAYNVPAAFRIHGPLDVGALEGALDDLVARHESLRTRFLTVEGVPGCAVVSGARLVLERADLSEGPADQREAAVISWLVAFARRPFDLEAAPLMRAGLVHLEPGINVVAIVLDHLIADGVSMGILLHEIEGLYRARRIGQPHGLPEAGIQYLDYVEWQRRWLTGGGLDQALTYWRRQLQPPLTVLRLPSDQPRGQAPSGRGGRVATQMPPDLSDAVRQLARREGVTPYMVLLAAFQVLMHRYTGETDIPVGTAIANRNRPEVARVVGFFANNLVMRGDLTGTPTLRDVLTRARRTAAEAYASQEMPFDVLVEVLSPPRARDTSPLFQVMLVLHGARVTHLSLDGLTSEVVEFPMGTARFDLTVDVFDQAEGLAAVFEYDSDLFDEAMIGRLAGHYRMLLEAFVTDLDVRVGDVPLVRPGSELAEVLQVSRGRSLPAPEFATLPAMFEAQVQRTPGAEALRFGDTQLTYGDLNRRANQLAWHLRSRGVGPESLVGIWMDRSVDMVVAVLAVLKAGGAYVPLDPSFPAERLAYMAADAGLALVLTQSHLEGGALSSAELLPVDTHAVAIAAESGDDPPALTGPDHLAYVLYTSGSTGKPKGVQIEHAAVVNFLRSMHREPGIGPTDRLVAVTTLSFDIAGLEIHGPLTVGGTVVLASRATAVDGPALAQLLRDAGATILQATPATWRLLLESGWSGQPGLKMLCGGEALPRDLADQLLATGGELWNLYGPTETTIWSTITRVDTTMRTLPIGRPIAETTVYVVEPSGQLAPLGVVGELCIGGAGLARGYRNLPELTAEKFVRLEPPGVAPERVYRTGDLVRFRRDGQLEFIGRRDHQVKLRGFRIELGEIETVLSTQPGVRQAVVTIRRDAPGDERLVAYVVPDGVPVEGDRLRAALRSRLPDYMVPATFVELEALPLTPNGKVDRKALPAPEVPVAAETDDAPLDEVEAAVSTIFAELLGHPIRLDDDFFAVGGHSLLAARVAARIEQDLGVHLPLSVFFEAPTLRQLAAFVRARTRPVPPVEAAGASAFRSLVSVHSAGGGIPVFGVHAGAGQVLFYRHFARLLGDVHPFYGLQAPAGLDGLAVPYGDHRSIDSLARLYLAEMRKVCPQGPYVIIGPCMGGNVAVEMAHMLRAQGEVVDPLIIVDSWLWNTGDPIAIRTQTHRQALQQLSVFEKVRYLVKKGLSTITFHYRTTCDRLKAYPAHRRRLKDLETARRAGTPVPQETRDWDFLRTSVALALRHKPRPYDGRVVLIRSATYATSPWITTEQAEFMGWRGIAVGELEVLDLPGTHLDMFNPPTVADLAKIVGDRIPARAAVSRPQAKEKTVPVPSSSGVSGWSDVTRGALIVATMLTGA